MSNKIYIIFGKITITIILIIILLFFMGDFYANIFLDSETINVDNNKLNIQKINSQKIISVYIEDLPYGIDLKYLNSIREAFAEWEKINPQVTFRETNLQDAEVHIQWIKEFGGHPLGQVVKTDFVQVGLGDSNCLNKWQPYTYETVLNIATHEIGHVLGLDHSNDSTNIMYESLNTKYEIDVGEENIIPPGYIRFYGVCTKRTIAEYYFEILSEESLEVYVVPSSKDYELIVNDEEFSHYLECEGKAPIYKKTCKISSEGGIVLINPNTEKSINFNIKIKEI